MMGGGVEGMLLVFVSALILMSSTEAQVEVERFRVSQPLWM